MHQLPSTKKLKTKDTLPKTNTPVNRVFPKEIPSNNHWFSAAISWGCFGEGISNSQPVFTGVSLKKHRLLSCENGKFQAWIVSRKRRTSEKKTLWKSHVKFTSSQWFCKGFWMICANMINTELPRPIPTDIRPSVLGKNKGCPLDIQQNFSCGMKKWLQGLLGSFLTQPSWTLKKKVWTAYFPY